MTKKLKISEYTTEVIKLVKSYADFVEDTDDGPRHIDYAVDVRDDGWYEAIPEHKLALRPLLNPNIFSVHPNYIFRISHVDSTVSMKLRHLVVDISIKDSLENLDKYMAAHVNFIRNFSIESTRSFLLEIVKNNEKLKDKFTISDINDGLYTITHIDSGITITISDREKIANIIYKMESVIKTFKDIKKYGKTKGDDNFMKETTFRDLYDFGFIEIKNKYKFKDGTKMKLVFKEFAGNVIAICKISKGKKYISREFTDVQVKRLGGIAGLISFNPKSKDETVDPLLIPLFNSGDADNILHGLLIHYNTNIKIGREGDYYIVTKDNSMTYKVESLLPLARTVLGFD